MAETGNEKMDRRKNLLLSLGVLGPGLVWLIYLQTAYLLAHFACKNGSQMPLHISSAAFLVCAVVLGFMGWCQQPRHFTPRTDLDENTFTRIRLMSLLSAMGAVQFALIIVGSWIAISILNPWLS
jgi:hypothetical protein